MISNKHPLVKTNTHLRQSIKRLEAVIEAQPFDPHTQDGTYLLLLTKLKEARKVIPVDYKDNDIKGE